MLTLDQLVGRNIRRLRSSAGLSVDSFAEEIGITADELALIEDGHVRATPAVVARCAEKLAVSIEALFQKNENNGAHGA
jgi:transcriptional regulator with XRE-family HTH domain